MNTITFKDFKNQLQASLDQVHAMNVSLNVKCPNGTEVVILSKADYSSMEEMLYLFSSRANANRLYQALEAHKQGGGMARELIDE